MNALQITHEQRQRLALIGATWIMNLVGVLALAAWGFTPVRAITAYGDLNNFDVFNDTGHDCYGFQVELNSCS